MPIDLALDTFSIPKDEVLHKELRVELSPHLMAGLLLKEGRKDCGEQQMFTAL